MASIDFSKYRMSDIERKLKIIGVYPLDVMVTGVTGAGKSTTLNSFFKKNVAEVGNGVAPKTMQLDSYSLNDCFRLWDTPGLGDGVEIDRQHKRKMIDLLYETYSLDGIEYGFVDMCMVIIEGSNRDMGTTYTLLNEVIVPNISAERLLVVINQADVAMKGRHWNFSSSTPDNRLLEYLEEQSKSIKRRVKEATGIDILKPVCYSAEYGWNVQTVFDMIIDHMPTQRRILRRNK